MNGVLINAGAIIAGGLCGLFFKKGVPKDLSEALMTAIGLCVMCIGITGILKGENTLILIASMVFGTLIGTVIDIDALITRLGNTVEARMSSERQQGSIAQGFITGSLLMCVGAMGIVGSLTAGITGDISMLLTKSVLDLISAALLAISLGIGVLFSAATLLFTEGTVVLLAQLLQPFLTDAAIAEMTCAGSVMILALGLNLVGLTKIKVANFLPALIIAPAMTFIMSIMGF